MARRRTSNRGASGTNRRRLFWARSLGVATYGDTSPSHARRTDLLAEFQAAYGADLFGFTVTRIIGHYSWFVGAGTVSTAFTLTQGIRIDDESEATSPAAIDPALPVNSPFDDWMFVRNDFGVTQAGSGYESSQQLADNQVNFDLRSQRRLDELGQSLYLFHGLDEYPGEDVSFFHDVHILCKRP